MSSTRFDTADINDAKDTSFYSLHFVRHSRRLSTQPKGQRRAPMNCGEPGETPSPADPGYDDARFQSIVQIHQLLKESGEHWARSPLVPLRTIRMPEPCSELAIWIQIARENGPIVGRQARIKRCGDRLGIGEYHVLLSISVLITML